ncbi:hypothetical protein BOX15_Mlig027044g2, partial [Macrostomum lignano]
HPLFALLPAVLLLGNAGCCYGMPQAGGSAVVAPGPIVGNDCPKSAPWPCKSGQCLSFAFICDGRKDCIDGYDEDKALCIAKDRPASIILKHFIMRFHDWLIPKILGNGTPDQIAKLLTEERNVADYAQKMNLTETQKETLVRVMEFAAKAASWTSCTRTCPRTPTGRPMLYLAASLKAASLAPRNAKVKSERGSVT